MTGPEYDKVVLRYLSGELKKCKIFKHVSFTRNSFKAITTDGVVEEVNYCDLKAVFYVKNMDGNMDYHDKKEFDDNSVRKERRAEVHFSDGEILRGKVLNYDSEKKGFFLVPADPDSNDEKVFVILSAVEKIEFEDV